MAEATSIPSFLAKLSPCLIHQFVTSKLADVPFGPQSPSTGLWKAIKVAPSVAQSLPLPCETTLLLPSKESHVHVLWHHCLSFPAIAA